MLRLDMHMIAGVLQYVAVASFAEAWIERAPKKGQAPYKIVASFAEAWIESSSSVRLVYTYYVASFAEAWIERLVLFYDAN